MNSFMYIKSFITHSLKLQYRISAYDKQTTMYDFWHRYNNHSINNDIVIYAVIVLGVQFQYFRLQVTENADKSLGLGDDVACTFCQ